MPVCPVGRSRAAVSSSMLVPLLLLLAACAAPAACSGDQDAALSRLCAVRGKMAGPATSNKLTTIEAEASRIAAALPDTAGGSSNAKGCALKCDLLTELSRTRRVLGQSALQASGYLCRAHRLGSCCQQDALLAEHGRVAQQLLDRECMAADSHAGLAALCSAASGSDSRRQSSSQQHRRQQQDQQAFDAIVSVTEWDKLFVAHALPYSLVTLADAMDAELHVLPRPQWDSMVCELGSWWSRLVSGSARAEFAAQLQGKRVLVVVEEAYLQECYSIQQLKDRLFGSQAKFLVLGSDTMYRQHLCGMADCHQPDLYLDLLDGVVEAFHRRYGVPTGAWMWTPSATFLKVLHGIAHLGANVPRRADSVTMFMRVAGFPVREALRDTLRAAGLTVHQGLLAEKGTLQDIAGLYLQSFAAVGSTASSASSATEPALGSHCRSMKSFRDWIAPPLGAVLVYDDHPDVLRKYGTAPTYHHGDWLDTVRVLRREEVSGLGSRRRGELLQRQQRWVEDNLLDWQLLYYVRQLQLMQGMSTEALDKAAASVPALRNEIHQLPAWVLPANATVPPYGCVMDPEPVPRRTQL